MAENIRKVAKGEEETLREGGKMRRRRSSLDRDHSYTAFLIACRTQQSLWGGRGEGRERGRGEMCSERVD